MKRISFWAHEHKWTSRFIIIACFTLLNFIGFFFGYALFCLPVLLPQYVVYLPATLFLIAVFFYPSYKEKAAYKNFYRHQKAMDGILVTTTFLMIICVANSYYSNNESFRVPAQATVVTEASATTVAPKHIILPKEKKPLKQWKKIKQQIRELRKAYKDADKTEKTLLVILAVVIASLLLSLVFALSCSLSCSGSEGAAILVFFLGLGLIVFLLIKVIRAIYPKPKAPKDPESGTTSTTTAMQNTF